MVAALLVATLGIPILTLLFQERDTEQRSRYEYLALLAARDEVDTARFRVAAGEKPSQVAHEWEKLPAGPLKHLEERAPRLLKRLTYSPEQARRLETRVELLPEKSGRLQLARLTARYLHPTDQAGKDSKQQRPAEVSLVFGLTRPPWRPHDPPE